ncbi:hypothetical protein BS47DRAFT_411535 [Hydnum rufescens UP504]|uniref:Uncharacterized protein n=1 Tax=Hydnum rufescens UP504 TaxID=1448309 RepID=A0A9P6BB78_9AGAM|nr:hypothetical protein BS47DRAFT_411535 [Hydnum rufescens UP504]
MLEKYGQQRGHPPQQQQPQQMQPPQPPSATMSHTQPRGSPSLTQQQQQQQQSAANMGAPHLRSASALGQQQQQLAQVRQQQLGQSSIPHHHQQQPSSSSLQQQHPSQYSSLQPPPNASNPENSPIGGPVAQEFGSLASFAKHLAGCSPEVLFQYAEQSRKQKMEHETKILSLLPLRPETQAELEQCVKAREHISSLEAIVSQIQMRRTSLYVFTQVFYYPSLNCVWKQQAPK